MKQIPLFNFKDKKEYAIEFCLMHTAKWKATLEDYADLNKSIFLYLILKSLMMIK